MIATTMLISLVMLSDGATVSRAVGTAPAATPVRLVFPAGVAVPLSRRDWAPAPSGLFKLPLARQQPASLVADESRVAEPASPVSARPFRTRPLCRL